MCRQSPLLVIAMTAAVILSGCHPQQPFYLMEDGDLSHYLDVATEMEYPDVEEETLDEVTYAKRPFSLMNAEPEEYWNLELQEVVHIALANSKVIRNIGGQAESLLFQTSMPDLLLRSPVGTDGSSSIVTAYDPAVTESNPRFGIEAALSAFDTQFTAEVFWEKIDEPRNSFAGFGLEAFFPRISQGETGSFQARLAKTAATGGTWQLIHNVEYDGQNISRIFTSSWNVNLEAEFRQPLLQGAGVQFNRIAGPGAIPGFNNGVVIARINTDTSLADFQAAIRNLVSDLEVAYWDLSFQYHQLDSLRKTRDSLLEIWQVTKARKDVGLLGALDEAQARQRYFQALARMKQAFDELCKQESRLRYLMGLAQTDGRLIRPVTEPTLAAWRVDWELAHAEALARRPELRRQRWQVKKRELELITAKNYLLPRLDAVGRYRWVGLGDDLLDPNSSVDIFDDAYGSLTSGNFTGWFLGLELEVPLGFRKEMAGVRNAQLKLARERARLQDMELETSHQLAWSIREVEDLYELLRANFDRRIAARDEVSTAKTAVELGHTAVEVLLDAEQRAAEAEVEYYRTLAAYNKAITSVHFRKGTLLDNNNIRLAEGPWPAKAYFDAHRRARARDASFYLDYGFTRPKVVSRGPIAQSADSGPVVLDDGTIIYEGDEEGLEVIPTPAPELTDPKKRPTEPAPPIPTPDSGNEKGTTTGQNHRSYDLGSMDLGLLGGRRSGNQTPDAEWEPMVKVVGHQQPIAKAADHPKANSTAGSPGGWSSSTRSGTRHATGTNSSAAETDWAPAGRSGL